MESDRRTFARPRRFPPRPRPAFQKGLTDDERASLYHLSEGGELFPVDWLLALDVEVPASDGSVHVRPFLDNIERFGLLPDGKHAGNPYGLPVGVSLARSKLNGTEMIGLNCSACHVGQVQYQGHAVRIDGAGNMAYVNKFLEHLASETEGTFKAPHRLARFWDRLRVIRRERRAGGARDEADVAEDETFAGRISASLHEQSRPARSAGQGAAQHPDVEALAGHQHRRGLRPARRVRHRSRRALRRHRHQQSPGRCARQHPAHLGHGVHGLAAVGRQHELGDGAQHRPGARRRRALRCQDVREHRAPRQPPSAGDAGLQDHAAEMAGHVPRRSIPRAPTAGAHSFIRTAPAATRRSRPTAASAPTSSSRSTKSAPTR